MHRATSFLLCPRVASPIYLIYLIYPIYPIYPIYLIAPIFPMKIASVG